MYQAGGVIVGTQSRSEYLRGEHDTYSPSAYRAIEFINERLPPDARVLFLGEGRGYYCRRDRICTTSMDRYPLYEWLSRSSDAVGLREFFREARVTHVLLNRGSFLDWQGRGSNFFPKNSAKERIFQDFQAKYLRPLFEDTSTQSKPNTAVFVVTD
jgi:hypothetical protein